MCLGRGFRVPQVPGVLALLVLLSGGRGMVKPEFNSFKCVPCLRTLLLSLVFVSHWQWANTCGWRPGWCWSLSGGLEPTWSWGVGVSAEVSGPCMAAGCRLCHCHFAPRGVTENSHSRWHFGGFKHVCIYILRVCNKSNASRNLAILLEALLSCLRARVKECVACPAARVPRPRVTPRPIGDRSVYTQ